MIKTAVNNSVKQVTNVRTIASAMLESEGYQKMLTEIHNFPVTMCTVERSFSSLRKLKTYLQNTMNACRLNNLFLLHMHDTIARKFVSANSRLTS